MADCGDCAYHAEQIAMLMDQNQTLRALLDKQAVSPVRPSAKLFRLERELHDAKLLLALWEHHFGEQGPADVYGRLQKLISFARRHKDTCV